MVANKHWTKDEETRLARHFKAIGTAKLLQAFPGRSKRALDSKANELKLKKCHDRLVEAARVNRAKRGPGGGFWKTPEKPGEGQVAPPSAA